MRILITMLFFGIATYGYSQGTLLVISSNHCAISIDGDPNEMVTKSEPKKFTLQPGEHYIKARSFEGAEKTEIVTIESGQQKILKLEFDLSKLQKPNGEISPGIPTTAPYSTLADINIQLSGQINEFSETGLNNAESEIYYAFDKGDEIMIDGVITSKKGAFELSVFKYPEYTPVFSKTGLKDITAQIIQIKEQGIYIIRLGTTAFFDKQMRLIIKRRPGGDSNFKTTVEKRYRYNTITLLEPTTIYVEGVQKGRSIVTIPVNPPANVIEWVYTVSASRDQQQIQTNQKTYSLLGDIVKVIGGINPATRLFSLGLGLISQPPGADFCDVYLMDQTNTELFRTGQSGNYIPEASRENVQSAKVKVVTEKGRQSYLNFRNTKNFHGIYVGVEAVGIVQEQYLVQSE